MNSPTTNPPPTSLPPSFNANFKVVAPKLFDARCTACWLVAILLCLVVASFAVGAISVVVSFSENGEIHRRDVSAKY
jgi:hypothetical protein